jgi:protein subunit release factor B
MAKYNFSKSDLDISFLKGSGPGGQNRNKRETAVRIIHIPTGLISEASERRSQNQNLQVALYRLSEKIEKFYFKPKKRVATKVSYSEQQKRLEKKGNTKRKKQLRKKHNYEME